ncbi:MAG: type II toxin-antitoxin system RelB family antitoxin [Actinomycetota bacterium]
MPVPISIRLTSEDKRRLSELSRHTGRSKTFYIREALHEHLDDLEERYWADQVVREWEVTGRPTRSDSDLWNELNV